jgi:hypothetical protein
MRRAAPASGNVPHEPLDAAGARLARGPAGRDAVKQREDGAVSRRECHRDGRSFPSSPVPRVKSRRGRAGTTERRPIG